MQSIDKENFIKKANEIHHNKYDYSLVEYVNAKTHVKIICPNHGEFLQTPSNHLHVNKFECKQCGADKGKEKNTLVTSDLIEQFNNKHDFKYDYSLVDYKNWRIPVDIICKDHGVFAKRAKDHINGQGCPECSVKYHGFYNEKYFEKYPETKDRSILFYILDIDIDERRYIKIGMISTPLHHRYKKYKIIYQNNMSNYMAYKLEREILETFNNERCLAPEWFSGRTECFEYTDDMKQKIEKVVENYLKPSSTFCVLPWIHLSTRPDGNMRVCCTANASSVGATPDKKHGGMVGILKDKNNKPVNFNNSTLSEAWNNDYMKQIRLQMLNNEIPHSCTKCFKEEESGHRSKRQWETEYWTNKLDWKSIVDSTDSDGNIPIKLPYIDLRFGTKCQLACIMCSPFDSSGWIPNWNKLQSKIENLELKELMQWSNKGQNDDATYNWYKNNPKFWKELYEQIPNMKQLYFAGGEALIIDAHYDLLEKCITDGNAENIELRYNSNGVEWREDLFDLWSHFKRVRFHYSIDSIEEMNDYIRYPSKWDHMIKQFHVLDNSPDNVEVTIACAVQALNIHYLPDLIKWKLEQRFKKVNAWPLGGGLVNFHLVYHPAQLNVKILPQWFKDKTAEKYEEFFEWMDDNWELSGAPDKQSFLDSGYGVNRLRGMISFMQSEDWSRRIPQFIEYINIMDGIRDTDFKTVFPEMGNILNGLDEDKNV